MKYIFASFRAIWASTEAHNNLLTSYLDGVGWWWTQGMREGVVRSEDSKEDRGGRVVQEVDQELGWGSGLAMAVQAKS